MAQQIKGKYISNDAIDGTRLLLLADQALRQEGPLGDIFDLVKHDSLEDKVYVKGEEVGYKSQIDQEASDRSAADSVLQDNIDAEAFAREGADNALSSRIDTEVSDRQSADTELDGKISVEKGRIDAILEASSADKDSFKEIVDLINSVDTENDEAFAAYVLSNDAALAQEVSDRQSGDDEIKGPLTGLESYVTVKALSDALVAEESNRASADQLIEDSVQLVEDSVAAESAAREQAVSDIQGQLDGLESYTDIKALNDAIVAEESARASADSTLQSNIDSEASARSSADSVLQGNIDSEESARIAADGVLQGNIDSEESARIAGDASLQSQINDIISNVDPLALDSLSEIVTAFQEADSDLSTAITNVLGTHTSELASEVAAREAADVELQSNIDSEASTRASSDESIQKFTGEVDRDPLDSTQLDLSGSVNSDFADYDTFSLMGGASSLKDASAKLNAGLAEISGYVANLKFKKEAFTSVAGDFSDGRDLGHQPLENSTSVTVGRLTLLEGIDYEIVLPLSAEDPTKIKLIGNGQADSLDVSGGEDIYVSYYCFDTSFIVPPVVNYVTGLSDVSMSSGGVTYFTVGHSSDYTGTIYFRLIVKDELGTDIEEQDVDLYIDAANGQSSRSLAPQFSSSYSPEAQRTLVLVEIDALGGNVIGEEFSVTFTTDPALGYEVMDNTSVPTNYDGYMTTLNWMMSAEQFEWSEFHDNNLAGSSIITVSIDGIDFNVLGVNEMDLMVEGDLTGYFGSSALPQPITMTFS
jgi:hypothetical protein